MSLGAPLSRLVVAALLAGACLAGASPARAQDPNLGDDARAQELYDNGVVLYDEGRYEDAILAWQEAYKLSRRPLLFYNMANAAERLGEYQDAIDHLNHYRAYAASDEREALDRRIKNLERRYDEQRSDPSVASSAPAGGDLGSGAVAPVPASLSSTPAPAPAPDGALGPGFPAPDGPLGPAPRPTSSVGAAGPAAGGGAGLSSGPPPLQRPPRRGPRAAPLVMYSIGGVGLAAGGTFAALALSSRGEAGEQCVASRRQTWCPRSAAPAIRRDQTFSLLADIGFAIGISGTIGGSVALAAGGPRGADVALEPDTDTVRGR